MTEMNLQGVGRFSPQKYQELRKDLKDHQG